MWGGRTGVSLPALASQAEVAYESSRSQTCVSDALSSTAEVDDSIAQASSCSSSLAEADRPLSFLRPSGDSASSSAPSRAPRSVTPVEDTASASMRRNMSPSSLQPLAARCQGFITRARRGRSSSPPARLRERGLKDSPAAANPGAASETRAPVGYLAAAPRVQEISREHESATTPLARRCGDTEAPRLGCKHDAADDLHAHDSAGCEDDVISKSLLVTGAVGGFKLHHISSVLSVLEDDRDDLEKSPTQLHPLAVSPGGFAVPRAAASSGSTTSAQDVAVVDTATDFAGPRSPRKAIRDPPLQLFSRTGGSSKRDNFSVPARAPLAALVQGSVGPPVAIRQPGGGGGGGSGGSVSARSRQAPKPSIAANASGGGSVSARSRQAPKPSIAASAGGGKAASSHAVCDDAPGLYLVVRRTRVTESEFVGGEPIAELAPGVRIHVAEVKFLSDEQRIRARITTPAPGGWLSLGKSDAPFRWAIRVNEST